ncbi:MAG: hypothetical protein GTN64_00225 [Candidatus Latescibacteria bacterium]|nr:hypothetical protein [Candidatus Latescibacterota bacterium]NIO77045.1 hypothetical protein [Candidatus Latescibacterota bacterium]
MIRFILMVLAILAIPILLFAGSDAMAAVGLPAPNPYMTMGTVLLGGLIKRGVKKMGLSSKTMPWLNLGATLIHTGITAASPGSS